MNVKSENMRIEVLPSEGVVIDTSIIQFGMNQTEIENILGVAPKVEVNNIMMNVTEQRLGMQFIYIEDKLSVIKISQNVKAIFEDVDLFNDLNSIEKLKEIDPDNETSNNSEYINFYSIGLSMGGFLSKKIPEGKLIIVFCEERKTFYKRFLNA